MISTAEWICGPSSPWTCGSGFPSCWPGVSIFQIDSGSIVGSRAIVSSSNYCRRTYHRPYLHSCPKIALFVICRTIWRLKRQSWSNVWSRLCCNAILLFVRLILVPRHRYHHWCYCFPMAWAVCSWQHDCSLAGALYWGMENAFWWAKARHAADGAVSTTAGREYLWEIQIWTGGLDQDCRWWRVVCCGNLLWLWRCETGLSVVAAGRSSRFSLTFFQLYKLYFTFKTLYLLFIF